MQRKVLDCLRCESNELRSEVKQIKEGQSSCHVLTTYYVCWYLMVFTRGDTDDTRVVNTWVVCSGQRAYENHACLPTKTEQSNQSETNWTTAYHSMYSTRIPVETH